MGPTSTREILGFQAEVKQLLQLMVHSLYGNKEIFLRELTSNASDAGDKLRFEAMSNAALYEADYDVRIKVSFDAAGRTITVSDNGIGMSRQEVIDQIGTIANSGTRQFVQQLAADRAKEANLIGVPILMKKEKWDSDAKKQVLTDEDEQINQASALWARSKSEITDGQYDEFYKDVGHDFEPPLARVHAKVEGRHETPSCSSSPSGRRSA